MGPWLLVNGICITVIVFCFFAFKIYYGILDHPAFIGTFMTGIAFYMYCYLAVERLSDNIKEKSQCGLVAKVLTAGFLMPTLNDIPEKAQSQAKDFNYIKVV